MKTAVNGFLADLRSQTASQRLVDLRIVPWSATAGTAFQASRCRASDFNAAISFVNGLSAGGGTNFAAAVASAPSFFSGGECRVRRLLFITDGEPVPLDSVGPAVTIVNSLNNVAVHGFNIVLTNTFYTAQLDNTPEDGVPVVSGSDPIALQTALAQSFAEFDMNPAHILRELVLSPDTGGSGIEATAGTSWTAAADVLYDEEFGLSDVWNTPANRQEFKQRIERHIDARVFQDRRTGLWEIKLIRDDYDANTLPVFDQSNVSLWEQVNFPEAFNLPNQLTVVYNNPAQDEKASVTITDPARVLAVGRIIPEKNDYSAVQKASLASRIAQRDLAALSSPLINGVFVTPNLPVDLNLGSPIKINNPRLGIINRIVRIQEIDDGDGRQNAVRVRFLEDRFAIADTSFVEEDVIEEEDAFPQTPDPRVVEEATYWGLSELIGQTQIDDALLTDIDVGLPFVLYAEVNEASSGIPTVEVNGEYVEQEEIGLAPPFRLASRLDPFGDRNMAVVFGPSEHEFIVGNLIHIGTEIARIKAVDEGDTSDPSDYWHPGLVIPEGSAVYTLELGRGIADTSPQFHAAGAWMLPWIDGVSVILEELFTAGDTARVKFLTITLSGVLDEDVAEEDEIPMASRAIRPYPPGDLRVAGSYRPGIVALTSASATWEHRDRLTQVGPLVLDHEQSGYVPEYGTSYTGRLYAVPQQSNIFTSEDVFGNQDFFLNVPGAIFFREVFTTGSDAATFDTEEGDFFDLADFFDPDDFFDGAYPGGIVRLALGVSSERDGYESWSEPRILFTPLLPPVDLTLEEEGVPDPPPPLEFDEAEVNLIRTGAVLRVPGQSVNLIRTGAVLRVPGQSVNLIRVCAVLREP
jgi:hypothetical protein